MKKIIRPVLAVMAVMVMLLAGGCATHTKVVTFSRMPERARLDMIDVSHHNGDIDWKTISRQVKYAYIKSTEGYHFVDDKYAANRDAARKNGVKVGPYHYFRLNHPAADQFENFRNTVGKEFDLIPVVDLEMDNNHRENYTKGEVYQEEVDNILAFLRMIEKEYKVRPILYIGGDSFYDLFIADSKELKSYPQWRRSIGDTMRSFAPDDHVVIWQYNGAGTIEGIDHATDFNTVIETEILRK